MTARPERRLKCLTVGDDFSPEAVDIAVDYGIGCQSVTRLLDQTARSRVAVRTDNGPEFASRAFISWAQSRGIRHFLIEPGQPMQNGYIESFNGRFRDECLNEHWFQTLHQARKEIAAWRLDYNEVRPHGSIGRMPRSCGATNACHEESLRVSDLLTLPHSAVVRLLAAHAKAYASFEPTTMAAYRHVLQCLGGTDNPKEVTSSVQAALGALPGDKMLYARKESTKRQLMKNEGMLADVPVPASLKVGGQTPVAPKHLRRHLPRFGRQRLRGLTAGLARRRVPDSAARAPKVPSHPECGRRGAPSRQRR